MFDFINSQQKRRGARGAQRSAVGSKTTRGDGTSVQPAKDAIPAKSRVIHSIFGVSEGREFKGDFSTGGASRSFVFSPKSAALEEGKLVLTGQLSVRPQGDREVVFTGVRATLVATQGGIGSSISRRQLSSRALTGNANVADAQQQQEQAKSPELKQESTAPVSPQPVRLTSTEYTDERGYVGVMYLKLSPLDASRLGGVAGHVDMSNVQLNALLAPRDDLGRDLHYFYTEIVAAAYDPRDGKNDQRRLAEALTDLNSLLKG